MNKYLLFAMSFLYTNEISLYDRNDKLLYKIFEKYNLSINISNIKDMDKFIDKLKKLHLMMNEDDMEGIIHNLKLNNTIYVYDKLINIYDKEILMSNFDKEIFDFSTAKVSELKSNNLKHLFVYDKRLIYKNKISLDYSMQEKLSHNIDADFSIIINYKTGEIYAIQFADDILFTLLDMQDIFKNFFYLMDYYNNNSKANHLYITQKSFYFFTKKTKVNFEEFLLLNNQFHIEQNNSLKLMNAKFSYPVILGDKALYEEYYSDLATLNLYIMHFCQALQILANFGSISNLTLDYIKNTDNIVSEKIFDDFNSEIFFNNFKNFINLQDKYFIYKKNDFLVYIHNSKTKIKKDSLNLLF